MQTEGFNKSARRLSTIGRPNILAWKSPIKTPEDLEQELAQYKKIVAELTLQNTVLKDLLEKSSDACRKARACRLCP